MAYYTFAHILQQGDMFGNAPGGIRPEHLTPVLCCPFALLSDLSSFIDQLL
jgi:hypothetical protein